MTENPPQWAYDRVSELHQDFAAGDHNLGIQTDYGNLKGAFARYIAEHEEPPVDPLLVEAREIVAALRKGVESCSYYLRGEGDNGVFVRTALTALRRGIEIARKQDGPSS